MYSQYKALTQKSSQSKMKKFISEADAEELCQMVVKCINTSEVIKILDDIMLAFSETNKGKEKKEKLVKTVFDALKTATATSKHVDSIVKRMVEFSVYLDKSYLMKLVNYFIERIRNNDDAFMSWKDVIPSILERLENEKTINYRGSDLTVHEYKTIVIRLICDIDWDEQILPSIAKMFTDLFVDVKDKQVCGIVMNALTSKLQTVDINELPPICHQMLKLGSEYNSILLFSTLSRYFGKKYASIPDKTDNEESCESIVSSKVSLKDLQSVESTVLQYIYESALNHVQGGEAYLKWLKSIVNAPEYVLDPFVMSVLLILSELLENQSLQILKQAFLRQVQEEESKNNSAWLRKVLSDGTSINNTINKVIDNSYNDRPFVLNALVNFAFVLLEIEKKASTEKHLPWEYGCKILQRISRRKHEAAHTVLTILKEKIVKGGTNVIQYTDCLAYMCRHLTMKVLEHDNLIMSLLEKLLEIPGEAATFILRAILPLMRVNGSIRDNLIITLRKALYRKGTPTRQMAVLGFLQLLKNLKLSTLTALSQSESLSSSHVGCSSSFFSQATLERQPSRIASNPWHNTSLCRELLAILSKCFMYELEVRCHLYHELYFGILKNQELTEYVIEMLMEHLFKYYEKDEEVIPPLWFERCSGAQGLNLVVHEPLADLIFSLQKIYVKVASKDSSRIDKLAEVLESLCKRMCQADLEHFGLDEETDLLDNMPKSQQKLLSLKLAISVYESLMAYKIASWSMNSVNIGQSIISLFKGYTRLLDYLKRLSKTKKGGKGKKDKDKDKDGNDVTLKKANKQPAVNIKPFNTVLDFDIVSKSIILLHNSANNWATEDQTKGLRERIEFHQYILLTCLQLLQNIKSLKDHDLQKNLELNKQNLVCIGETLYKYVITQLNTESQFNDQVAGLALDCFKECCDIMCTVCSTELSTFLEAITGIKKSEDISTQLQGFISMLKDIFKVSIEDEVSEEKKAQKISLHLLEIISILMQKIRFENVDFDIEFEWLFDIAENVSNLDLQTISIVYQLILLAEDRSVEYGEKIQEMCVEFCAILGKTDKSEVTSSRKFQSMNETNVYVSYIAVNKILAIKLNNVNWFLGRLNAEYTALLTNQESDNELNREKLKERERSLCRQFSFIIGTFELMASAKIMPGAASDAIFKNLQKLYNFASALTKYFKKRSNPTNPAFQAAKFIPVIQKAGSDLKRTIQELYLHVEVSQSGGKSSDTNVQKNKILKEVSVIPSVVQATDSFVKEVALLSKKAKVNLMNYITLDSIRDFRIKSTQLKQNLEEMNITLVPGATQGPTRNENQNEDNDDTTEIDNSTVNGDVTGNDDDDTTEAGDDSDESKSESDASPAPKRKRRSD